MPALVMNCLAPSITHSPPSRRARVRVLPASEPASGSVRPKAASRSPDVSCGQPLLLLLLRAEQVDRLRAERGVRAERDRDRGVDARELLDRDRVGERVGAGAAVLLGERDPHPAELAELPDDLVGEGLRPVELAGDRGDLALGEVADGGAERLVLLGEVEVHGEEVSRRARPGPRRARRCRPRRRGRRAPCRRAARCSGSSIFIASTTTSCARASTSSPGATSTRITLPGIGAAISSRLVAVLVGMRRVVERRRRCDGRGREVERNGVRHGPAAARAGGRESGG